MYTGLYSKILLTIAVQVVLACIFLWGGRDDVKPLEAVWEFDVGRALSLEDGFVSLTERRWDMFWIEDVGSCIRWDV